MHESLCQVTWGVNTVAAGVYFIVGITRLPQPQISDLLVSELTLKVVTLRTYHTKEHLGAQYVYDCDLC